MELQVPKMIRCLNSTVVLLYSLRCLHTERRIQVVQHSASIWSKLGLCSTKGWFWLGLLNRTLLRFDLAYFSQWFFMHLEFLEAFEQTRSRWLYARHSDRSVYGSCFFQLVRVRWSEENSAVLYLRNWCQLLSYWSKLRQLALLRSIAFLFQRIICTN